MKVIAQYIEMIAHFKEDGSIIPIKFRIYEDAELKVVKIDKIQECKIEKLCGNKMLVYTCCGIVNGINKMFEIKYDIEQTKWMLFKI